MSAVHVGISLCEPLDRERAVEAARLAEQLGFDGFWLPEHPTVTPFGGFGDPLLVLSHLAATTRSIRLGTSILVLPYRSAVLVANQAATLDVLSGGRFTLGVGAGHDPAEFAALGIPRAERGARLDEGLEVITRLWTAQPVTFAGRFAELDGTVVGTAPSTPAGPPLWIGGNSAHALRRAVRFGSAWHGEGLGLEQFLAARRTLERLLRDAGRDPGTLQLTMLYTRACERDAATELTALIRAGLDACVLEVGGHPAETLERIERIGLDVLPALKGEAR